MLKQMVNVSSAELEGWSEQVERLQIRKQDRGRGIVGSFLGDQGESQGMAWDQEISWEHMYYVMHTK